MFYARIHNIYIIYGYGVIEYTYLVGSAQSKQADNQDSSVTVTYNNHQVGSIRIPSNKSYKHPTTQAYTQAHNSPFTDPN